MYEFVTIGVDRDGNPFEAEWARNPAPQTIDDARQAAWNALDRNPYATAVLIMCDGWKTETAWPNPAKVIGYYDPTRHDTGAGLCHCPLSGWWKHTPGKRAGCRVQEA